MEKTLNDLARIRASLSRALESARPEEWRQIVRKTVRGIDDVMEELERTRAENGEKSRTRINAEPFSSLVLPAKNGHVNDAVANGATPTNGSRPKRLRPIRRGQTLP